MFGELALSDLGFDKTTLGVENTVWWARAEAGRLLRRLVH